MARLPRLSLPGLPHYVHQNTVHGQPLAPLAEDREALLAALAAAAEAHRVQIWGYAVLPQQLQLLVCPADASALGRAMQTLGRRYVPAYNRRHARRGALWAGRFRAAVLEPGRWTLAALRHIDGQLAPQRAEPGSVAHHLGLRRDPWLAEAPELWSLGNTPFERETAYRALLEQGLAPETERALEQAVHGAWLLGSPAFAAEMAARAGRPARPRPPGRPRRTR